MESIAASNTLSASNALFATYVPVNRTSLNAVIAARRIGRRRLRENNDARKLERAGPESWNGENDVFEIIENGGSDGTRTRDLRRDRPAL